MADRMETYQQRVGVEDAGSFRPVLPEVADAGGIFQDIGRTIIREARPKLEEKAQREAIAAAGVPSLVKVGEGFQPAQPMPKGAGSVFAKVYEETMAERQLTTTVKAYEGGLAVLQEDLFDDPEMFDQVAQGQFEGILKAANPLIRPKLEESLLREYSERSRGLHEARARREYEATVEGNTTMFTASLDEAKDIMLKGGDDWRVRARVPLERADQNINRLVELGQLNEQGAAAKRLAVQNLFGPIVEKAESKERFEGFGRLLQGVTNNDDLKRLVFWGRDGHDADGQPVHYTDAEGKDHELTFDQFKTLFPDDEIRGVAARSANDVLTDRVQAERDAVEAQRAADALTAQKALLQTAEQTLAATRDLNYDPVAGLDKSQVAGIRAQLDQFGPISEQFKSEEGRARLLTIASTTGYVPEELLQSIDARVSGGDFAVVMDFVEKLKGYNHNGAAVGQMAFERLNGRTQALVLMDETIRRGGMSEELRFSTLEKARNNRLYTDKEAVGVFAGAKPGHGYADVRRAAIIKVFGGTVEGNPLIKRDYDNFFRINLSLANGDTAAAASAAAQQVKASWAPVRAAVGGVLPRKLVNRINDWGVPLKTLAITAPGKSPEQRAAIKAGRFRLEPLTDNPEVGYGRYAIYPMSAAGKALGRLEVDMDAAMKIVGPIATEAKAAAGVAAMRKAITEGPPFVLRGGKYVPREQALAEFDRTHPKAK